MGISTVQLHDPAIPKTAYNQKELRDTRQSSKPKFIQSETKQHSQKLW